ncbi:MAG TPA: helix-turn-helix domain-containing protein [Terriglobales bacterium]|nr:helix-turn-helix domain-containing protein [Terriglobales bacterium]
MAVTRTFAAGPQQFFQQIDRIIKSHSLRGSESLCKLLQYLAKQSLDHPDAPLKEYQIATEVYGRHADFDPQSDSTIRVQAGRLRLKLAEYYATEGANDSIVVKIPKGSYHLIFEAKPDATQPLVMVPQATTTRSEAQPQVPVRWRIAVVTLLACLIVAVVMLLSLLWTRKQADAASSVSAARPLAGPLAEFWKPFTAGAEEPWVIFSNAAFIGRPETGMRYYNSRQDSKSSVYDHYTGVGEVLAVHSLDEAFGTLGHRLRVKRGSLFTLDDASNANLIFVGSPSENLSLLDIPGTQEFVFERVASGARKGDLSIVSRHPKAGETANYLASPSNAALTEDYAVVGMVPGVSPSRFVMILAGTTTFGTQGAVEFVCRPDSVEKLMREMQESKTGMKPFEALVRVKIARGVPLETELVAVRPR